MFHIEMSTAAERRLYVDAMFYCLSRGILSDHAACNDVAAAVLELSPVRFAPAEAGLLTRRVAEILQRFRLGASQGVDAREDICALLEAAAKTDIGDLRAAGLLADA